MTGEEGAAPLDGIHVLTIGSLAPERVEAVVALLSRRLAVPCRLSLTPRALRLFRIAGRDQVDADRLLEQVETLERPEGHWTVALTDQDLGNPIFTFFFGRARHHAAAVLVSMARLTPAFYGFAEDEALTVNRTVLEILHELGHAAGLEHCHDFGCVMRFAATVEDLDNRGTMFCRVCANELPAAFGPAVSEEQLGG